ncbi:MAG TPA: acyl-CoA thioesterase domain-containing protein, partial [Acidimicrobiales bacterium]
VKVDEVPADLVRAGPGDRVAFDHHRVRIEVDDDVAGETTVKRFPTWGDATQLVDLLDVRPDQADQAAEAAEAAEDAEDADHARSGRPRFVTAARADWRRPVVEGSQILGQSIVAAGRHAPGRRAVAAHLVFLRPADALQPLTLGLDELTAGRTFTTLAVQVHQGERHIATGTLLLDAMAPGVVRHGEPPPAGRPGPLDARSEPYDMGVTGQDVRIVDGAYTGDPDAPVGPPELDAWVRHRPGVVPADDPYLHAGLLAHFTGHLPIAAALRPHAGIGQHQAHRTISTAINAVTLSLHTDVRADEWLGFHHRSTFAGDGMTHAECRVHDEQGTLVASFTVEAMVRPFRGAVPADERRAL